MLSYCPLSYCPRCPLQPATTIKTAVLGPERLSPSAQKSLDNRERRMFKRLRGIDHALMVVLHFTQLDLIAAGISR